MEENNQFQDDPINYFKSNIQPENESFNTIFLGCPKPQNSSLWIIFAIALGIYFVFSIFIGNIILLPMSIEGASMYPTLNNEYTTTGNKYATDVVYLSRTQTVSQQDIIVFDASPYNSYSSGPVYYIKRVIAKEGDTIQFIENNEQENDTSISYSISVNGLILKEDYISENIKYSKNTPTTNIVTSGQELTIPNGYVFVLGDNRNNSTDSRELGLIKTSDIVGKVIIHIPYGDNIITGIFQSIKNDYLF